ncbi:uncharacterized protein [Macrobrachium rosenbergii]|uniref:uncharacterized protein n=1 Tax=Macrobrachium rosenbergii TaxID=79674 RepID=UPI0034D5C22D
MSGQRATSVVLTGRVMLVMMMVVVVAAGMLVVDAKPGRGPHFDTSISDFINERTCWTGEICKTEFQTEFRCKCPRWYWCRSPGRYYHAYCSMSALGYIWLQPGGLQPEDALQELE